MRATPRQDNGKTPTGGSYNQVAVARELEEDGPKSLRSTGPPREVLKQRSRSLG
jgi:hypothetical protein